METKSLPKIVFVANLGDDYLQAGSKLDSFDSGEIIGTYQLVETSILKTEHTLIKKD